MLNRKQSILAAALECVSEHGLDACTIEMIREREGHDHGIHDRGEVAHLPAQVGGHHDEHLAHVSPSAPCR